MIYIRNISLGVFNKILRFFKTVRVKPPLEEEDTYKGFITFSFKIYKEYLTNIKGIFFSYREIDIISSLLNKEQNEVSSFLQIDPRGVESHSRNIRKKIGNIHDKDALITFIKDSDKFYIIKNDYFRSLQIRRFFEKQLDDLTKKMIHEEAILKFPCTLLYEEDMVAESVLVSFLKIYLDFVGRFNKTYAKEWNQSPHYKKIIELLAQSSKKVRLESKSFQKNSLGGWPIRECRCTENIIVIVSEMSEEIRCVLKDATKAKCKCFCIILQDQNAKSCGDVRSEQYYLSVQACASDEPYSIFFKILGHMFSNEMSAELEDSFKKYIKQIFNHVDSPQNIRIIKKNLWPFSSLNQLVTLPQHSRKRGSFSLRKVHFPSLFLYIILGLGVFSFVFHARHNSLWNTSSPFFHIYGEIPQFLSMFLLNKMKKEQAVCWNLPRQDHKFVGRQDLLDELQKKLHFSDSNKEISGELAPLTISACAGLGGIGKTQLALQYVHHTTYPYSLRAWFPAENLDELKQKYIEFAKFLGNSGEKLSFDQALSYVKNWLTLHPGWLLVYDNVEDYEKIAKFLPTKGGYIILTTRQRRWPSLFNMLLIDVMKEEEAVALIHSLIHQPDSEDNDAKQLAQLLGYLPLALSQAGAYIRQNGITIKDYLELYKICAQKLLSEDSFPKGTNVLPISVTWNISLAAIQKESELNNEVSLALEFLTVCSYLAPEKISREMLLDWVRKAHPNISLSMIALQKGLGQLWRYSMINFDGTQFVSVHRLVQTVVRHKHTEIKSHINNKYHGLTSEWFSILLEVVHTESKRCHEEMTGISSKKISLSHLQALVDHCDSRGWKDKRFLIALSNVLKDIADIFHYHMHDSLRAQPYYARALSIQESCFGKNHVQLAPLLVDCGDNFGASGKPQAQKEVLERALEINEGYYGTDDARLFSNLENLGAAYWALGNTIQAKKFLRRALILGEKYYGVKSIKIVQTLYFMGNVLGDSGEFSEQQTILERALAINAQYYGQQHIQTALILENLGVCYLNMGDSQKGQKLLHEALAIQEKCYGNDHVEIGETLGNLSNTYIALGQPKEAMQFLERSLKILSNYYGKDHVYVARTQNYLGDAYIILGKFNDAITLLEHVLKIKETSYQKDNVSIARTLTSLGRAYAAVGLTEQASQVWRRALGITQAFYGENHFITKNIAALLTPSTDR